MSRIIICDRCGSAIPAGQRKVAKLRIWDEDTLDFAATGIEEYDLCEDCSEAAMIFLAGKKPPAEEAPAKTAAAPVKKAAGKQPKIDVGKAQALRDAGWSLERIAEELGCSSQTVANHTTKPAEGAKKVRPNEWSLAEPDLSAGISLMKGGDGDVAEE